MPLLFLLVISLVGCGENKSKTTQTDSSKFSSLNEKKAFLERYVQFRRNCEDLDFSISYIDGEDGGFPSPTEWDIKLLAKIPATELDEWIKGLKETKDINTEWVSTIPNAPDKLDHFEWYADAARILGFDRKLRTVIYRNHTQ